MKHTPTTNVFQNACGRDLSWFRPGVGTRSTSPSPNLSIARSRSLHSSKMRTTFWRSEIRPGMSVVFRAPGDGHVVVVHREVLAGACERVMVAEIRVSTIRRAAISEVACLVLAARRTRSGCARSMPAHGPGPRPKNLAERKRLGAGQWNFFEGRTRASKDRVGFLRGLARPASTLITRFIADQIASPRVPMVAVVSSLHTAT